MLGDLAHDLDDLLRFGDIENPGSCRTAFGGNLVGNGLDGSIGAWYSRGGGAPKPPFGVLLRSLHDE